VRVLNPEGVCSPSAAFSQAVIVGDMAFVAGQCGLDAEGAVVGPVDVAAQTVQAIANIETILHAGGFGLSDVVQVTTFLSNLDDFDSYDRAYAEAFGSHRPARATVRADIHSDDLLVEIQAVAKKG
jgi:2-iminobutanoate/2-iminopropanoate deaminase